MGAARAKQLEDEVTQAGFARVHSAPYLNEFAIRVPDAVRVHARLVDRGFVAGLRLADWYPGDGDLADALLLCATEVTTEDDISSFAAALREVAS
jgi:glycine dehydrogenase subunit 1